jgi:hypothetical protein
MSLSKKFFPAEKPILARGLNALNRPEKRDVKPAPL